MNLTLSDKAPAPSLLEAWHEAKRADPRARARDIAEKLGVPEGALVAARAGEGVAPLSLAGPQIAEFLKGLASVGPVMTLTRNDTAVHETTGTFGEVVCQGPIGQVTGEIDLRLFFRHWHAAYLVSEEVRSGLRHSVQVFDGSGTAVIKIYAVEATDMAAWQALIDTHRAGSAEPARFAPIEAVPADRPDGEIDRAELRRRWLDLEHSHNFHGMLRDLGVGRLQALRLAGDDLARKVDTASVERMLRGAAESGIRIMCFVGNRGAIQIFSGPVEKIVPMGPWLNVLDAGFNLHLRADRVASCWAVIKPTRQRGQITSLELFDAEGELACQFFGVRPPGAAENDGWRKLVEQATGAAS